MNAVIFDLDDTLYPEQTYVRSGFAAVAAFLAPRIRATPASLAVRLAELHARDGRGRLFDTLIAEKGVPDPDRDLALSAVLVYRSHAPVLAPFPDVVQTLDRLRAAGVRVGLLSDGLASVQRAKLRALDEVVARLDAIVLTDELGREFWKPSPVPFRVACTILEVAPGDAAYVGNDPRKDFAGARLAGLRTIRVRELPDEGGARIATHERDDEHDADADTTLAPFSALPGALGL